jgi:hypothetical protein
MDECSSQIFSSGTKINWPLKAKSRRNFAGTSLPWSIDALTTRWGTRKGKSTKHFAAMKSQWLENGLKNNMDWYIYRIQSPKETAKVYCYYKMDRPFLRLAPIKVEIMRFNPLAVFFRNVISDEEIERIKELARPKLARATVQVHSYPPLL